MLEITKATTNDIEIIRKLAFAIWPDAYGTILSPAQLDYMLEKFYSTSSLHNQMAELNHSFILIKWESQPIGFAAYSSNDENPMIYHLNKLYVLPDQQGKHAGKLMLDYIISDLKKLGALTLQLNVNRYNKALHFYAKNGFQIIREQDIDIGKGYFMNDYVMEMALSPTSAQTSF